MRREIVVETDNRFQVCSSAGRAHAFAGPFHLHGDPGEKWVFYNSWEIRQTSLHIVHRNLDRRLTSEIEECQENRSNYCLCNFKSRFSAHTENRFRMSISLLSRLSFRCFRLPHRHSSDRTRADNIRSRRCAMVYYWFLRSLWNDFWSGLLRLGLSFRNLAWHN